MTTIPLSNISLSNLTNVIGTDKIAPFSFSSCYSATNVSNFYGGGNLPIQGNKISMSIFRGASIGPVLPSPLVSYDMSTGSYTSGTSVLDKSGNNYTATFNTAPSYSNLSHITISGLTQKAASASVSVPITNNTYSIELLFRMQTDPNNYNFLFGITGGPQVQMANNSKYLYIYANGTGTGDTGAAIASNTWYHVVFSIINGTAYMYLNGVSRTVVGGYNMSFSTGSRSFAIGDPYGTRSLLGDYALVRFYNVGLSSTDVSTSYNSFKTKYGLP